jgi:two-component system, sensor histidine kinase
MPLDPSSLQGEPIFLPPGGEMGDLIRSHDWSTTPLGQMEQWPQTLLTSLATILDSPFPQFICWGRELTMLYNDAYIELLGHKHPALGKRLPDVWPEARETIDPMIEKVFSGNSASLQNAPFTLLRKGYPEETWFDFSFSPLRDNQGNVVGLLNTTFETTRREQELRESEERYRALINASSQALYRLSPDWKEMRQLRGGTFVSDTVQPNPNWVDEYIHPDDRERVLFVIQTSIQTGTIFELEHRVRRVDGSLGWSHSRAVPVRNAQGEIVEWFGAASDITERKRAEEALRESEERFSKSFHSNPAPMAVTDIETGRVIDINAKWLQMLGYTRDEIIGRTTIELGIWANSDKRPGVIRRLRSEGSLREVPNEFVTKSGEIRHALWSGEVIEYGGKSVLLSLVYDITERKRVEESLSVSEEKFRAVFEGAMESIYLQNLQGRFLDVNRNAYEQLGYSKDEMLQMTPLDIDANASLVPERIQRILDDGSLSFETFLVCKDGSIFSGEINSKVIQYGGENIILTVVRDVTERKKLELSLRDLAESLEDRVRRRTAELEQANLAKDQFLANMSHEIRTPMAGVLGMTEILLHQELPEKAQDDLEMIRSSAESVMTLINDLFDLSRISQGRLEFRPIEFDVRAMIKNAIDPFEFQARSKDLDFILSIDESVPSQILCDKDRLAQVLKNLVSNAIKFTEQGFVRVHVKAEKNDEDTLRLNFTVADSGMGIPKNKQKDVFNAFTQLDPSYSKKFAGMGLGLAISKSLVEGMGGEISVESTKGHGSTFRFYVTCGIVTEEQEPTAPSITLHDLPPMTILIAEDNAVNRLFLRRSLVTSGHRVGEAENGRHALKKLKDTHFDLVLMDVQMPEMDGVEATRRIRSGKHGRADIPIIALTAYAMKGDREKFLEGGMDGYVTKPVDFGELARTIAEVCRITTNT